MTTTTANENLESLSFAALRQRFTEATGEISRSPNRTFMIRRIVEARAARAAVPVSEPVAESANDSAIESAAENAVEPDAVSATETAQDPVSQHVEELAVEPAGERATDSAGQLATESPERSATESAVEPADEPGAEPDEGLPIESDAEPAWEPAQELAAELVEESAGNSAVEFTPEPAAECAAECTEEPATTPADSVPTRKRGRFASMTIEQLQAKYLEVVGRSTDSSARNYLEWKIREAEKGRITIGPRQTRTHRAEPLDVKILPLRLAADAVDKMDEAWRSRGLKTEWTSSDKPLGIISRIWARPMRPSSSQSRAFPAREGAEFGAVTVFFDSPQRPKSAEQRNNSNQWKIKNIFISSALLIGETEACMSHATGTEHDAKREDEDDENAEFRNRNRDNGPEQGEARRGNQKRGGRNDCQSVSRSARHDRRWSSVEGGSRWLAQRNRKRRNRFPNPRLQRY